MNAATSPDLLHGRFWRQVDTTPGATALVERGREFTYAELGERAGRLAAGLARHGIGPGSVVGLHVERSIDWVACVLGILTANAAVVPLPPSYPAGRLRQILEFARLDAVIDVEDSALDTTLPARRLPVAQLLADAAGEPVAGGGRPEDAAFVLCTSGSTGHPKMIVRSHRSFFHRLRWTWERHPFAAGERSCQKSHATTTHAVYELFEPLLQGIPVMIIPDAVVRDLERFWATLRSERISRLLIVPAQLQASLAMPGFVPPPLRTLVLMGEYVSPALAQQALATWPASTAIYSIYGSTEASSTLVCDLRASFRPGRELPLGRPIANDVAAVVLDPAHRPVAVGDIGRLHVAGPALFSGYFRDAEATAAAFIDGPGVRSPLYDTGDEVRLASDGHLEFIGRTDHTVKVRGFRVDTREVEGALLSQPGISEAAVLGGEDGRGAGALEAYVAPATVDPAAVFRALRDRLPEYMVPARLSVLDALPLTPGGKIDRLRLRSDHRESASGRARHRPLSPLEREVAQLWETVIDAPDLPPDASFFEVGGTSLSAYVLVHRLRERFRLSALQLDVEAIYRTPTIEALADRIEQVRQGRTPASRPDNPVLVTLRGGRDGTREPVFFIAPAGGMPGSYGKLARRLATGRELVGVRDPFNWGARDPAGGFDQWVGLYVAAMIERQPRGPYYIVAYSSAAAFGYETARRLRAAGERVPLLALIDPIGLDTGGRSRYGWWAARGARAGPVVRALIHGLGLLRRKPFSQVPWLWALLSRNAAASVPEHPQRLMQRASRDRFQLLSLSALLELNSGIPYALDAEDLDRVEPDDYLGVLRARIEALSPEVDFEPIERVVQQYPLQLRAQEAYRLQPYDGEVLLMRASSATRLVPVQLKPYVARVHGKCLPVGQPSARTGRIAARWGRSAAHFRCMRDDDFVAALAEELDALL